jgi:cellulose synthase/poly-beta-1,6-N-acetylglucosamine synthase-like glycosyltransferase
VVLTVLSGLVVASWALFALMLPRARRQVPRLDDAPAPTSQPLVSVIVPARNEAELLPRCLTALAAQQYPHIETIVVDDQSTDGTSAVAAGYAGVRVLAAGAREAGWAGKNWAAHRGAQAARGQYLLFLDADARLQPTAIARTVAHAEAQATGLLTVMPDAECATFWEALVQPVMLLLLIWQLDPRHVNDPDDARAAAPGAFLFFSRAAYDAIGGHAAVRGEIVDDLKLAQRVKGQRLKLRLVAAPELVATRRVISMHRLWTSWLRVVVDGLDRHRGRGLLAAALTALMFILPMALAPLGWVPLALGAAQLVFARSVRAQLRATYGIDDRLAWLQPLGALFAVAVLLRASLRARGAGPTVEWQGRKYQA